MRLFIFYQINKKKRRKNIAPFVAFYLNLHFQKENAVCVAVKIAILLRALMGHTFT